MPAPSVTAPHYFVFIHWKLFAGRLTRSVRVFKVEERAKGTVGAGREPRCAGPLALTEPPTLWAGVSEGPQARRPHPCHVANVGGGGEAPQSRPRSDEGWCF